MAKQTVAKNCGTRSRESQRTGFSGPRARRVRNQGFPAASVFDPTLVPKMVQVKGTEVNSTRQEEEERPDAGSQQQKETTRRKARSRSPRGDRDVVSGRRCTLAKIPHSLERPGKGPKHFFERSSEGQGKFSSG